MLSHLANNQPDILVGEIYDEHDIAGEDDLLFEELEENVYLVDAEMYVEEFFERLNVGDVPEDVPAKMSGWSMILVKNPVTRTL